MKRLRCGPNATTIVDDDFILPDGFSLVLHTEGYARAHRYAGIVDGRTKQEKKYLHRMIIDVPPGMDIDHINMNRLDNRRCNLRACSRSENMANNRKRGITKSPTPGKWIAQVTVNYKNIYLGTHDTEALALSAVREWKQSNRPIKAGAVSK